MTAKFEATTIRGNSDVKYVRLDDFRKKLIIALLEAGKGRVTWSKVSEMQPDKLRQVVMLDNKKYMVHFWKNKLTDIYLMEKNRASAENSQRI